MESLVNFFNTTFFVALSTLLIGGIAFFYILSKEKMLKKTPLKLLSKKLEELRK